MPLYKGMNMKSLFIASLLVMSFQSFGADIVCGSVKAEHKRTYPINDAAIKLAAQLKVKTCTGTSSTRFKDAVKAGKHNGSFKVVDTAELIAAKAKLAKMGGVAGPTWN